MNSKRIWILTLFPEYFSPLLSTSGVIARSLSNQTESKLPEFKLVQIREWAINRYGSVDDTPFGGGPGMIMRADVLAAAIENGVMVAGGYSDRKKELKIIYTSPRGKRWDAKSAHTLAESFISPLPLDKDIVFICGRYEGVDERFLQHYVDQEISIGDFVLSGGEIAVMAILDSSLRLCPGILGNKDSLQMESFENKLLEAPQYTRPRVFEGEEVPAIYLSGHHEQIEKYKRKASTELTLRLRPDLLQEKCGDQSKDSDGHLVIDPDLAIDTNKDPKEKLK